MLKCSAIRDTLLDSPTSRDSAVVAHLMACAACRTLAEQWQVVDVAFTSWPTPATALQKRNDFLASLTPVEVRKPRRAVRRWLEWTVAASLFFGIATVTFVLSEPREVAARPRIVEELVEWNLTVAEADSREIRESLVRDRLPELREAVRTADLEPRDRELAVRLMNEGQWQAKNTDPLESAERLHGLAEEMLTLANEAELTSARSVAFVKMTAQIADRGVNKAASKAAVKQAALQEAREQARLARLQIAQERQAKRMADLAAKQAAAEEAKQARLQKKGKKGK